MRCRRAFLCYYQAMHDFANLTRCARYHPALSQLPDTGLSGYLVGGFIRDALLGRDLGDVDLVLEGDYEAGLAALAKALGREPFRLGDRFRADRFALPYGMVDVAPLQGKNREEDLLRRDFTINAIAVGLGDLGGELSQETLIDPAQGLEDLAAGRLVAISEKNLLDDPLRILRAFRFMVQLGFSIEEATGSLLSVHAGKLTQAAPERIREELMLMLRCDGAAGGLNAMDAAGVLTALFPEIEQMRGFSQNEYHHLPVLEHSLECVRELEHILLSGEGLADDVRHHVLNEMREVVSPPATRAALTKLALLFHDIGKPQTAQQQEDGKLTFYGHQGVGRSIASAAFQRIRLSNQERDLLELLIEEHLRIGFYCNDLPVSNKLIYRYCRKLGEATAMSCLHALADARATRGEAVSGQFVAEHEEVANAILWHLYVGKDISEPTSLLTGEEIMELTGLPEGPRIGELKEALLEAQVEGLVRTREDAERFIARQWKHSAG